MAEGDPTTRGAARTALGWSMVAGAVLVTLALAGMAIWRLDWGMAVGSLLLGGLALGALLFRAPIIPESIPALPSERAVGHELLLANPDPVVAVDRRAVIVAANEAAQQMIAGLKIGEPLAFALRAPEVLDALRLVATTGEPQEAEFGGRAGQEAHIAVHLRALPGGPDTRTPAVALFFRDRTRERRIEAMRVDFIATVSHELRTPLASLTGFIDTLAGPARDDTAARSRFLGIMRDQAARMTRLVDDLLRLSRVELNEHVAPTDPIELGGLVAHMVEIMSPLGRERGVSVSFERASTPVVVKGDRDELLRVIENLLENAMKYGGPGQVRVGLRVLEGGAIELSVSDEGPGIAPEHLPRLTERFYRVDEQESRARGGTGLGLAIVKHVVGRHRGRLAIESEQGVGTTVRIQFPRPLP